MYAKINLRVLLSILCVSPANGLVFPSVDWTPARTQTVRQPVSTLYMPAAQLPFHLFSQTKQYLYKYYGKQDFGTPSWQRVRDFLIWEKTNQPRLTQEFLSGAGKEWEQLPPDKQETLLGAWLGMKYALDRIAHRPEQEFRIVLLEETGDTPETNYVRNQTIYCSKGDFATKINIGLHQTIRLLSLLGKPYPPEEEWTDFRQEKYTAIFQQRYGLPVKMTVDPIYGTRTFFPIYYHGTQQQMRDLLNGYAEEISSLIDYDRIKMRPWKLGPHDHNDESLKTRLQNEIFSLLLYKKNPTELLYSIRASSFFSSVGQKIIDQYCNQLPSAPDQQVSYIRHCFDEHTDEILTVFTQTLLSSVSGSLPAVPHGYQ